MIFFLKKIIIPAYYSHFAKVVIVNKSYTKQLLIVIKTDIQK